MADGSGVPALPEGLRDWAALDGARLVLDAVRQRAARSQHTERGVLRLALTAEQRRDVGRLLGTRWEVSGRAVRLQDVAAAAGEHGLTVRGLVEALDGAPVVASREVRERRQVDVAERRQAARQVLLAGGVPAAVADGWLAEQPAAAYTGGELTVVVDQVRRVWPALPGPEGTPVRLATLAATSLSDAHALDADRPAGRAVARLAAAAWDGPARPQRSRQDWRRAWRAAGVLCDEVSSRVLVLNLELSGTAPAVALCAAARGEPVWLTLRALAGEWTARAAGPVFVCENPSIVEAAADVLGAGCAPLVCTDGNPSTAATELLRGLAAAGCRLRVRADFDPAGLGIVHRIRELATGSSTWRFDGESYASVAGVPGATAAFDRGTLPVPVHEEALLPVLLADLGR